MDYNLSPKMVETLREFLLECHNLLPKDFIIKPTSTTDTTIVVDVWHELTFIREIIVTRIELDLWIASKMIPAYDKLFKMIEQNG